MAEPAGPDPRWYLDIAQVGDLVLALQATFDAAGVECRAGHMASPGWRHVAAEVRGADRTADVVMGIRERAFVLQFWARGVCMAHGTTTELAAVAGAMHAWQSGVRIQPLISNWPFLATNGFARAFERSDAEAIDYRWLRYHDNTPPAAHLTRLRPFIALAFDEPLLRALLPSTSHWTLHFSRHVGYPYSNDCPSVRPLDDGRYLVIAADGREQGPADAAGAVAFVLAALGDKPLR